MASVSAGVSRSEAAGMIGTNEFVQRVGLTRRTISRYQSLGWLPGARNIRGGHRGSHGFFPVWAVSRVELICRLMQQGYVTAQITEYLSREEAPSAPQVDDWSMVERPWAVY